MQDFSVISPHLDVRISSRARRLALRLDSTRRRVCLVIPQRASLRNAYMFALEHKNWIEEKIGTLPKNIPLYDGISVPLLGKEITIRIEKNPSLKVTEIELTDTELKVLTRLDDPEPRILRFIKKTAEEEFRNLADEKAASIGCKISTFTMRDMKTRWGSCSTDGKMALSWRLIFAPSAAYDYVIAHETAHLAHPNHGPHFWKLCEKLSVDFSAGHTWMKHHGTGLMRYGKSYS